MATKKATTKRERSGFDAPAFGTIYPKGTTWKMNPDGTRTAILPKGAKTKEVHEDIPRKTAKKK